jgi:hypothetical protein
VATYLLLYQTIQSSQKSGSTVEMAVTAVLSSPLASAFLVYLVYLLGLVIYRLYFHPLANFPGPKYAAVSRWHEFYYEVIKKGQFTFKVQELHKQYGLTSSSPAKIKNSRGTTSNTLTRSYRTHCSR